eukprot:9228872-Lingulodinium_polyedra.AAC.1
MADNLDFASPWLLDAKSRGRTPGGGRCISAEIRIRRVPMRTTDEPEATVFGDAGRHGEYRIHTTASDQHAAL